MGTKNAQDPASNSPSPTDDSDAGGLSTEVQEFVAKTVNAASSNHMTLAMKAFDKKLVDFATGLETTLAEKLQSPSKKDEDPTANDDHIAQIKQQYEGRLKDLEKKFEAEKSRAESERINALRSEERSRLGEALRTAGVSDDRLRGAVALLYTEDNRVGRSTDGTIVFKFQRDGYQDEVPLAEGVAEWASSDEGKQYLPAKPIAGSGHRGGRAPARGQEPTTRRDLLTQLGRQMMEQESGGSVPLGGGENS